MVSITNAQPTWHSLETVNHSPSIAAPVKHSPIAEEHASPLLQAPIGLQERAPTGGEFYDTDALNKAAAELSKLSADKDNIQYLSGANKGELPLGSETYDLSKLLKSYLRPSLLTVDQSTKTKALEDMSNVVIPNDFHEAMMPIAADPNYGASLKQAMDESPELKIDLYGRAFHENTESLSDQHSPTVNEFQVLPNSYLSDLDRLYGGDGGNGLGTIANELVHAHQKSPVELEALLGKLQKLDLNSLGMVTGNIHGSRSDMENLVNGLEKLDDQKKNDFYRALLPLNEDGTVEPGMWAGFFDSFGTRLLSTMFHLEVDPAGITSLGSYYQNAPWEAGYVYNSTTNGFRDDSESYYSPEYALDQLDKILNTQVRDPILNVVQTNPFDYVSGNDINQLSDALEKSEGRVDRYYLKSALSGLTYPERENLAAGIHTLSADESKRFFKAASTAMNLDDLRGYHNDMEKLPYSLDAVMDNPFSKHAYSGNFGWLWGGNSFFNSDKVNHAQILKDAVSETIANPQTEAQKDLKEAIEKEGGIDKVFD